MIDGFIRADVSFQLYIAQTTPSIVVDPSLQLGKPVIILLAVTDFNGL